MNKCDRLTAALVFCVQACIFFALAGSLSLHVNRINYHISHPTVTPTSVHRAENRELCYIHTRERPAFERPGGLCTNPPSDQHWCVTQACFANGYCYYDYAYYSWPSWCFKPVLTVTLGNTTRTFTRDCGTSLECMEQFDAQYATYVLGDEQNFVLGKARYKPRPEEIALLAFSVLFGVAGLIAAAIAYIHGKCHKNADEQATLTSV